MPLYEVLLSRFHIWLQTYEVFEEVNCSKSNLLLILFTFTTISKLYFNTMFKNIFFSLVLSVFYHFTFAQVSSFEYANTISPEDLKKHLSVIASDDMQGRETGSEGQFMAASYIANHFRDLGLKPIVPSADSMGYFQNFALYQKGWTDSYLEVNGNRKVFFKDFFPNGMVNVPDEISTEVVFVRYGLEEDFENRDFSGKAVVFFEGAPDKYIDEKSSSYSTKDGFLKQLEKDKIRLAEKAGASYIFIISTKTEEEFTTAAAERRAILGRFNRMSLEKGKEDGISKQPGFTISNKLASEILGLSERKLKKTLNKPGKKPKVLKSEVKFKSKREEQQVPTMNVLGLLEGTDKKEEVLVLTAHYDHIGTDRRGEVYNGADDDGSGTCAILELAEAFVAAKKAGHGPRRSILFMTVTGEEKGLLGSRYFTDIDPVIPLNNLVCNLNIDMIGRVDEDHKGNEKYVYLIGSDKLSSELHAISEKANQEFVRFDLDYTYNNPDDPNRFYYRSDHYNFAKNGIPVIFYFTGVHEDYHGLGDEIHKIRFFKYAEITKLVFHTAWEVANREKRIVVDSNKK